MHSHIKELSFLLSQDPVALFFGLLHQMGTDILNEEQTASAFSHLSFVLITANMRLLEALS